MSASMKHDLIALVTRFGDEGGRSAAGNETHKLEFNSDLIRSEGFTFGSSPRCSITLPSFHLCSEYHCAITFARSEHDNQYRLVLRDLSPTHKIRVLYEGDEIPEESTHQWVLAVRDSAYMLPKVIVEMAGQVKYDIQPMFSGMDSGTYNQKVEDFLERQGQCESTAGLARREFSPLISEDDRLVPLSEVGKGGFGVVSRVVHVTKAKIFACKTPQKSSNIDHHMNLLEKEAAMLKDIRHDHIVTFAFVERSYQWNHFGLFTEYIPQGDLWKVAQTSSSSPLTEEECLQVLYQCSSALDHLHTQCKIIHRDIKPHNILVAHRLPEGGGISVKLCDFGLATKESGNTCEGTPEYQAPEIKAIGLRNARFQYPSHPPQYSYPVDMWSLGLVLCELVYPGALKKREVGSSVKSMAYCEKLKDMARFCLENDNKKPEGQRFSKKRRKLHEILGEIVKMNSRMRWTARECLEALRPEISASTVARPLWHPSPTITPAQDPPKRQGSSPLSAAEGRDNKRREPAWPRPSLEEEGGEKQTLG